MHHDCSNRQRFPNLPSLSALTSLRTTAAQPGTKSFIGFGDPLFKESRQSVEPSRGINRRNATAPGAREKASQLQSRSSNLELLEPLPDTSEEVREIAKILRANEKTDVNLGQRASEQLVKSSDLSQYRVVMFATHGLPVNYPSYLSPRWRSAIRT
jgi:CHAT domain-containing protein